MELIEWVVYDTAAKYYQCIAPNLKGEGHMVLLWQKDSPIISSILETDAYKILMLYFIYRYFPKLEVQFEFTNRKSQVDRLGSLIPASMLTEQLDHVRRMRITDDEIEHIASWMLFPKDFLEALRDIRLPEPEVSISSGGDLRVIARGNWFHTTLWELYVLPIVSECRARMSIRGALTQREIIKEGERRLLAKIERIKNLQWPIALFDLRRRLSGEWEKHTTEMLLTKTRNISGVSNVHLARHFKVEAQGTNAHELYMALAALRMHESDDAVRQSGYEVLEKWQSLYGHKARIMLPDTFGSAAFFEQLPIRYLRDWRGSRQDSGDPHEYARNRIQMYRSHGIDPKQKLVIFSDALTLDVMESLERSFINEIGGAFGWGTNKVHDVPILSPLSIVMKLTKAGGNGTVKLSDDPRKASGKPEHIAYMQHVFR